MKKLFLIISVSVALLHSCNNPEPVVQSPFSHLDTVKVKVKTEEKEVTNESGGVKSPFSNLDKK